MVALSTQRGPEATRLLEEGAIDLALIPNAIATGSMDVMPLFQEPLLLIGRAALIGTGRGAVRTQRALSLPLVYPDRSHDARRMVDRLGLELGVTPNIRYEHNSAEIMAGLIESGLACTVMSASPFASEIGSGEFATRRINPPASRIVSIAWRRDRPVNPAIRATRNLLIEVVATRMNVIGGRLLRADSAAGASAPYE
ncbi:MAG: LysR substrate-binding domain-containing protein [Burkholderiaceae bacterium]